MAAKKPATAVAKPLTEAEFEHELHEFLELVLRGYSAYELKVAAAQSLRAPLEKLLAAAEERFRQAGQADPDVVRGFCIEAYRELYSVALNHAELGVALRCLARLEAASK